MEQPASIEQPLAGTPRVAKIDDAINIKLKILFFAHALNWTRNAKETRAQRLGGLFLPGENSLS